MRIARRLFVLLLLVGLFWLAWRFTHGNTQPISVDLVLWRTPELPLWGLLLAAFGLGAACAGASLLYELARKSLLARRYRKAVAGLETEVHELRNLPLAEAPEAGEGAGNKRLADSSSPGRSH